MLEVCLPTYLTHIKVDGKLLGLIMSNNCLKSFSASKRDRALRSRVHKLSLQEEGRVGGQKNRLFVNFYTIENVNGGG